MSVARREGDDPLRGLPEAGLATIVYSSRSLTPERSAAMAAIRRSASERNARLGIAGFLHREEDMFFQCLEGPPGALREVMALLQSDPRHNHIQILLAGPIAARRFPDWAMGFSDRSTLSLFDWLTAGAGRRRIPSGQDTLAFLLTAAQAVRAGNAPA